MRRKTKKSELPIYAVYAIYDNGIDDRIYKVSYCRKYKLEQIKKYYAKNYKRKIEIIFDYFSTRYTKNDISDYIDEFDEKLNPLIIHKYSHEANRKRVRASRFGISFEKSIFGRDGIISFKKILEKGLEEILNENYTISDLRKEKRTVYAIETDRNYIPANFWDYGLTFADLPQRLQKKLEKLSQD